MVKAIQDKFTGQGTEQQRYRWRRQLNNECSRCGRPIQTKIKGNLGCEYCKEYFRNRYEQLRVRP